MYVPVEDGGLGDWGRVRVAWINRRLGVIKSGGEACTGRGDDRMWVQRMRRDGREGANRDWSRHTTREVPALAGVASLWLCIGAILLLVLRWLVLQRGRRRR